MKTSLHLAMVLSSSLTLAGLAQAGEAAPASSSVVGKTEAAVVRGAKAAARGVEHGAKAAAGGVERGATAAAHGVDRGVKATARGVEHGAKATSDAANRVSTKLVGSSSASGK